ncbi:hypothetical protein DFH11DRAFT_1539480 [Phellopilus nigrolimitatus]|nr:hypothetical protein DFH11DRAFT_1539480 [Phellopilus nigrolimitatus]
MIENLELREQAPVYFKGILNVTEIKWLTERGEDWLRHDVLNRSGLADDLKYWINHKHIKVRVFVVGELLAHPGDLEMLQEIAFFPFKAGHRNGLSISTWSRINGISMRTRRNKIFTPRHVHRAEIYALFGRHSQWLLEKSSKKNLLNKGAWQRFCLEVEARLHRTMPPGQKEELDNWDELEKLWAIDEDNTAIDNEPRFLPLKAEADESELEYFSDHGNRETYTCVKDGQTSRSITPDEKPPSSRVSRKYTDPAVLDEVPKAFYKQRPIFPTNFEWCCSEKACQYAIHFHRLSEANLEGVDRADREYLQSMCWSPTNDSRIIELFHDMVERHYYEHLEKSGIRHVTSRCVGEDILKQPVLQEIVLNEPRRLKSGDTNFRFEWVKPKNHKPAFFHLHE